jgi:hypothetical protein
VAEPRRTSETRIPPRRVKTEWRTRVAELLPAARTVAVVATLVADLLPVQSEAAYALRDSAGAARIAISASAIWLRRGRDVSGGRIARPARWSRDRCAQTLTPKSRAMPASPVA